MNYKSFKLGILMLIGENIFLRFFFIIDKIITLYNIRFKF